METAFLRRRTAAKPRLREHAAGGNDVAAADAEEAHRIAQLLVDRIPVAEEYVAEIPGNAGGAVAAGEGSRTRIQLHRLLDLKPPLHAATDIDIALNPTYEFWLLTNCLLGALAPLA